LFEESAQILGVEMNDETDSRFTAYGLFLGLGCAALLIFYVIHSGAQAGGNRSCSTCRPAPAAAK
jgi:hypothetical protein